MNTFKDGLLAVLGFIGGAIGTLFGGWSDGMVTLLIFMAIDYVTGLIVAAVFKKSRKSETGALQSAAGLKGLFKKGAMWLVILVAVRLDIQLGTTILRDAAVIAFIVNESISIVENMGLMGVPIPKPIIRAIDILKKQDDEKENETDEK